MATKTFKYGHLFSTSATTIPADMHDKMIAGEISLILNEDDNVYKMLADDGDKVVDLGAKIGGKGDEKTIDTQLVSGDTIISSLVYLKDVTADETLPANVQKRFRLVNAQGENVVTSANTGTSISSHTSDFIDIYKDSSIVEVYVGTKFDTVDATTGVIDKKQPGDPITDPDDPTHTAITEADLHFLDYMYYSGGFSGITSGDSEFHMVQIDLQKFLTEGEFASGVTVNNNGIVTGVVDPTQEVLVTEWTNGDESAAGVSATTESGLTVGESGFSLVHVQEAIDAKHANVIYMNGYTSGVSEDVFGILSGDTIMQAIKKVEDKIYSNGDGKNQTAAAADPNNTGIVFIEGSDENIILKAGTF